MLTHFSRTDNHGRRLSIQSVVSNTMTERKTSHTWVTDGSGTTLTHSETTIRKSQVIRTQESSVTGVSSNLPPENISTQSSSRLKSHDILNFHSEVLSGVAAPSSHVSKAHAVESNEMLIDEANIEGSACSDAQQTLTHPTMSIGSASSSTPHHIIPVNVLPPIPEHPYGTSSHSFVTADSGCQAVDVEMTFAPKESTNTASIPDGLSSPSITTHASPVALSGAFVGQVIGTCIPPTPNTLGILTPPSSQIIQSFPRNHYVAATDSELTNNRIFPISASTSFDHITHAITPESSQVAPTPSSMDVVKLSHSDASVVSDPNRFGIAPLISAPPSFQVIPAPTQVHSAVLSASKMPYCEPMAGTSGHGQFLVPNNSVISPPIGFGIVSHMPTPPPSQCIPTFSNIHSAVPSASEILNNTPTISVSTEVSALAPTSGLLSYSASPKPSSNHSVATGTAVIAPPSGFGLSVFTQKLPSTHPIVGASGRLPSTPATFGQPSNVIISHSNGIIAAREAPFTSSAFKDGNWFSVANSQRSFASSSDAFGLKQRSVANAPIKSTTSKSSSYF